MHQAQLKQFNLSLCFQMFQISHWIFCISQIFYMLKNKKVMTETVISYHSPNVASSQCDQESLNICSQLLVSERDRATFPITSYRYKLVKNTQSERLKFQRWPNCQNTVSNIVKRNSVTFWKFFRTSWFFGNRVLLDTFLLFLSVINPSLRKDFFTDCYMSNSTLKYLISKKVAGITVTLWHLCSFTFNRSNTIDYYPNTPPCAV